jgi:flagellar hook-associated protein 1 FlgK
MSLTQALATAVSGLRANQSGLALVASNVANAGTAGYVRKTVNQVAVGSDGTGISVNISGIQREIDLYIQRQLRTENAGASYADTRAQYYQQLQTIYGQPGAVNALETMYNNFTTALQALSTSPDDNSARSAVINSAQLLTQQLNQMSDGIQALRSDAELGLSDAVSKANNAMTQIAELNQKLASSSAMDGTTATLMDQRDAYVDQLSQLMDINVTSSGNNQITVFTNSGVQLVGSQASQLSFDTRGTIVPASQWSADPLQRGVGTITLNAPNGGSVDLIQSKAFRSGVIAADLQMRDQDLVQAQSQLDAIAAAMATALSNKTTAGSPASSGLQTGFGADIGNLSTGNTITINYTDTLTSTAHTLTLVRVDDPSILPLADTATVNPNDQVVGIDFSAGMASVLTQINTALGATGMTASYSSGTVLQVLDDGAGNTVDVDALSTTATVTSLSGGSAELPFFTDGNQAYTGAFTSAGSQSVGFAGRITLNSALVADPSKLVAYQVGIPAGDGTRPDFIYQQLTSSAATFSPDGGIGTVGAPFSGPITTYLRQVISQQGEAADTADKLKQGQDIVLNSLQQRFNNNAGVNVDQEMANLMSLQNSYAANARVMSVVSAMFDTLLRM